MGRFSYIARTKDGTRDSGTIEAPSQDDAVTTLQKKGLVVTSIVDLDRKGMEVKKKSSFAAKVSVTHKFGHAGVRSSDLVIFARQLAMLLGAGVSLLKSLEVILKQIDSKRLYAAVLSITKDMEAGRTFKDAVAKFKSIFSDLWIYLIETGEASGNLPVVLSHLAKYLEDTQAFKRKIVSALMYPCVLLIVAIGAVIFFVVKIVPTFTSILASFNVELPLPTKILITVSNVLRTKIILFIVGIGLLVFFFKRVMKIKTFRTQLEHLQLRLPIFGNFFRFMMIEAFSTTMSILIESGVPIIYALDISERSQPYMTMQDIIGEVKTSVREGKSFGVPLSKSDFFPPMVVQMVSIGEEIGELSAMFKRISLYYQEYLEAFVTRIAALFEPLMIVFMGGIIGAMVISIFLPIFNLATATAH